MANRYANLVGTNKINNEFTKINDGFDLVQADVDEIQQGLDDETAAREALDERVDTIIQGGGEDKDAELVDIRTPDSSYTPLDTISVAGDITRDMQKQFVAHQAETVTGWFNGVTKFGVPTDGTSDSSVGINSAIDAAHAAGGGVVFLPPIVYKLITAPVAMKSGVYLYAPGATFDMSALSPTDYAVMAQGTKGTLKTITANAVEGVKTISVDSTGLAAGDWIIVHSEAVTGTSNQRRGEICRIESVTTGSITLYDPLCDTYNTSDTAQLAKLTLIENVRVEGLNIIDNGDTSRTTVGLYIEYALNTSVRNCKFKDIPYIGLNVVDSVGVRISDCHFQDITKPGFAYGVAMAWAVQDSVVTNCTGIRMRHAVMFGGGTSRYGVARRCVVSHCTASQCIDAGFDSHPGPEDIVFVGNTVNGSLSDGIVIQCSSFVCANNNVRDCDRHGYLIEHISTKPIRATVQGNLVQRAGGSGIFVAFTNTYYDVRSLIISGNSIDRTTNISIQVPANLTTKAKNIVITNNGITNPATYGIYVRTLEGFVISGNVVSDVVNTAESIYVFDSTDGIVSGNKTQGGARGIRLNTAIDIETAGNRLKGAVTGILVEDNSNNCVFMGNNARGCATPYSFGTGTGHIYQTAAGDKYNRD